ncbi:hypothetical protein Skr01_36510 [Sphaerisporangium krabiense]|uniref:Uncharacterized protein n=1 Tax=Sphaerisporangium krabiense TaxID=763782 RepID=A0A7W8Z3D4_9ACTN|nr:hypothetical protein [Sphaerisporangium krabiense]MBB5626645.1 hypothetical protein [Sphaerisporangium krabiense]GII63566.1 hypothetical protein Skr01_36510 [Sphaerisporangium krabiense]
MIPSTLALGERHPDGSGTVTVWLVPAENLAEIREILTSTFGSPVSETIATADGITHMVEVAHEAPETVTSFEGPLQ